MAQARGELERLVNTQIKLNEARRKLGIPKMEAEIDLLKSRLVDYMIEHEEEKLNGHGHHATLVQGFHGAHFVGTKDELAELEISPDRKITPLRTIIYKKFSKDIAVDLWMRVTKRVVVKEAVEEVIAEGLLSVKDVAPSFVEQAKKPYIRVFQDGRK